MCSAARVCVAIAVVLLAISHSPPAQAQATRTWVSGVGDDANPCSRTAPCKTFAGAISKTAAGGQISVLDSGGFGAVTITKSISIVAEGAEGGILAALTNGIIVNAQLTDEVSLHGLTIEGAGSGLNGVRFLNGGALHIRHCLIRGFQSASGTAAIDIQTTGNTSRTFVSDTTLSKNHSGVHVKPGSPGSAVVFLDRVVMDRNTNFGIRADARATVRMNNLVLTSNGRALSAVNGGEIISFGNNAVAGNVADGTPTETVPLL